MMSKNFEKEEFLDTMAAAEIKKAVVFSQAIKPKEHSCPYTS